MKEQWAEENRAASAELRALVAGLGTAAYGKRVEEGWTVATMLCHLALWDGRAAYTLEEWKKTGKTPSFVPPDATDLINLAARDVFASVPGEKAAEAAVRKAEAADAVVASLDESFCSTVAAAGLERMLRRAAHRRHHMEQIRKALR